jgi:hypothetical protein
MIYKDIKAMARFVLMIKLKHEACWYLWVEAIGLLAMERTAPPAYD